MSKQLFLIEEKTEEKLTRQVEQIQERQENLRKSVHAKVGGTLKLYLELKSEIESLKAAICHNRPIYTERLF